MKIVISCFIYGGSLEITSKVPFYLILYMHCIESCNAVPECNTSKSRPKNTGNTESIRENLWISRSMVSINLKIIQIFSSYPVKCLKLNQSLNQSFSGTKQLIRRWEILRALIFKWRVTENSNDNPLEAFYLLNILEGSDRYLLGLLSPSSSSLSISSSRNIQI